MPEALVFRDHIGADDAQRQVQHQQQHGNEAVMEVFPEPVPAQLMDPGLLQQEEAHQRQHGVIGSQCIKPDRGLLHTGVKLQRGVKQIDNGGEVQRQGRSVLQIREIPQRKRIGFSEMDPEANDPRQPEAQQNQCVGRQAIGNIGQGRLRLTVEGHIQDQSEPGQDEGIPDPGRRLCDGQEYCFSAFHCLPS